MFGLLRYKPSNLFNDRKVILPTFPVTKAALAAISSLQSIVGTGWIHYGFLHYERRWANSVDHLLCNHQILCRSSCRGEKLGILYLECRIWLLGPRILPIIKISSFQPSANFGMPNNFEVQMLQCSQYGAAYMEHSSCFPPPPILLLAPSSI